MQQLDFLGDMGKTAQVSTRIFDLRPAIFDAQQCADYLQQLLLHTPWEQRGRLMYGKPVLSPRLSAWYADDGMTQAHRADRAVHGWTPLLLQIRQHVETLSGIRFNAVLLNLYRDQHDSVAWHSDRDGVPGREHHVASVSFGQARPFELRHKHDPRRKFSILLSPGSYLLMRNEFQLDWQHRVPKCREQMGPRINLTFRVAQPPP